MHVQLETQKCIRISRIKVILLENSYSLSVSLFFIEKLLFPYFFFKVSWDYFVFNQITVMDYPPSMHAYYDYTNA